MSNNKSTYKSVHCKFWGTTATCVKGSACRYFHDGKDDPDELRRKGYFPPSNAKSLKSNLHSLNSNLHSLTISSPSLQGFITSINGVPVRHNPQSHPNVSNVSGGVGIGSVSRNGATAQQSQASSSTQSSSSLSFASKVKNSLVSDTKKEAPKKVRVDMPVSVHDFANAISAKLEADKKIEELEAKLKELENKSSDAIAKASVLQTTLDNIKTVSTKTPIITKYDPNEPEFIQNTNPQIVWEYDSCVRGFEEFDTTTSSKLEKSYQDNQGNQGGGFHLVNFDIGSFSYFVNLSTMLQTNKTTNTQRKVRRRSIQPPFVKNPKYIIGVSELYQLRSFNDQFEQAFNTSTIPNTDKEYLDIEKEFLDSANGLHPSMRSKYARIEEIVKVTNPISAKFYELRKEVMTDKSEIMLFHGTRGADPLLVAKNGLDNRLAADTGYFGRGIYGSRSACYCHETFRNEINGVCTILYVKFLIGNTKKYSDNTRDNLKRAPEPYDSVTCDVDNYKTTIFTVYDPTQVYIAYMIKYKIVNQRYSYDYDSDID